jgi:hypothetical protein
VPITYTIKTKRANPGKGFAPIENDITDFLPAPELKIHSSEVWIT